MRPSSTRFLAILDQILERPEEWLAHWHRQQTARAEQKRAQTDYIAWRKQLWRRTFYVAAGFVAAFWAVQLLQDWLVSP